MRALVSGDLHGIRDNSNRWKIPQDEAQRWIEQRPDRDQKDTADSPVIDPATVPDTTDLLRRAEASAAAHEARADALAAQVEDLQIERDRLLSIIERQQSETRPGLIARLFGR